MSVSKCSSGRSRSCRIAPCMSEAAMTAVTSPSAVVQLPSFSPSTAASAALRVSVRVGMSSASLLACDGVGAPDLVLELQDPVDKRLGGGGTARDVDVDWHDAVAAAHHRVRVVIVAAAVGAGPHRDDPARLGHLVVDFAQGRRHLVA